MTQDPDERALAARLHAAADEANDAADHDELHAAASVVDLGVERPNMSYLDRWIKGLIARIDKGDTDG